MKSLVTHLMMKRGRIYILPTKMGGYFNGLIFLMFLLSVGYSNNLLLIFTLTLFALNLVWVIQTHFHLRHLEFDVMITSDAHAGSSHPFSIQWRKAPELPHEWEFKLIQGKEVFSLRTLEHEKDRTHGEFILPKRGIWKWEYLKISSSRPFGLYKAWRYQKIEVKNFTYPALKKNFASPNFSDLKSEGEEATGAKGAGDFHGLSPYSGEEARRISWKHYARSGELLVRDGEEVKTRLVEFTIPTNDQAFEEKLSELASQMLHCHRQDIPFTFQGPRFKLGPGTHAKHLSDCLKELSLC